jgi:predicted ester cyclase
MARDINIAAQERFAEGVNSGNFDIFDEVVAPDVVDHDPAPEQGPGPEGFKEMFRTMRSAFPDLQVTPEHITATDEDVALAYTITGTHEGEFLGLAPTGSKVTARGSRSGASRTDVSSSAGAPPTSSPSCSSSARSRSRAGRRGRRS